MLQPFWRICTSGGESKQIQANAIGFEKQVLIKNGQTYTRWTFHPAETPKGRYFLKIGVGNTEFDTRPLNIVD